MTDEWQESPRHPQDERLRQERDQCRDKYEAILNEQIILRNSLEGLRAALIAKEKEVVTLNAHLEASRLISDRLFDAIMDRVNK